MTDLHTALRINNFYFFNLCEKFVEKTELSNSFLVRKVLDILKLSYPNYIIVKINQITEGSPGDLKILAVTQTAVKDQSAAGDRPISDD